MVHDEYGSMVQDESQLATLRVLAVVAILSSFEM
jgi:hypothetical protein